MLNSITAPTIVATGLALPQIGHTGICEIDNDNEHTFRLAPPVDDGRGHLYFTAVAA
jgi:hypothetical protein